MTTLKGRRSDWKRAKNLSVRTEYVRLWNKRLTHHSDLSRATSELNYLFVFVVYFNEQCGDKEDVDDIRKLRDDPEAAMAAWQRMQKESSWSAINTRRVRAKLCTILREAGQVSLALAVNPRQKGIEPSASPLEYIHRLIPDRVRILGVKHAIYQFYRFLCVRYHQYCSRGCPTALRRVLLTVDTTVKAMYSLEDEVDPDEIVIRIINDGQSTMLQTVASHLTTESRECGNRAIRDVKILFKSILQVFCPSSVPENCEAEMQIRNHTKPRNDKRAKSPKLPQHKNSRQKVDPSMPYESTVTANDITVDEVHNESEKAENDVYESGPRVYDLPKQEPQGNPEDSDGEEDDKRRFTDRVGLFGELKCADLCNPQLWLCWDCHPLDPTRRCTSCKMKC